MYTNKIIIVINGKGGSGKDTICEISEDYYDTLNVSSVDIIKKAAALLGWDGDKDINSRKFLSDLKKLSIEYNNFPLKYLHERAADFLFYNTANILFVHIREPEEIEKFISLTEQLKVKCVSLLVTRNTTNDIKYNNNSDDNVNDYKYDYFFENNYDTIDDLGKEFLKFLDNMLYDNGIII